MTPGTPVRPCYGPTPVSQAVTLVTRRHAKIDVFNERVDRIGRDRKRARPLSATTMRVEPFGMLISAYRGGCIAPFPKSTLTPIRA